MTDSDERLGAMPQDAWQRALACSHKPLPVRLADMNVLGMPVYIDRSLPPGSFELRSGENVVRWPPEEPND